MQFKFSDESSGKMFLDWFYGLSYHKGNVILIMSALCSNA